MSTTREKGIGTISDSVATNSTGNWTIVALLKGIWQAVTNIWYSASFIGGNASIAITSTAQQLSSKATKGICIQASHGNAAIVYIGWDNTVSNTVHAFALTPGSCAPTLSLPNANKIWIYGTAGDKISYGGDV